jgi:hypothetical protein
MVTVTEDGSAGSGRDHRTFEIADLRQRQATVRQEPKAAVAGEPDGLARAAGLEARFAVLQSQLAALSPCSPHLRKCSEIVTVRPVQVRDRLLQHHGRHLTKPRPVLAQLRCGGDLIK